MTPDLESDEFVSRDDVPLLHEYTDPGGRHVTPFDIDKMVEVNNALVAAGELPVIHIGHNVKGQEKPIKGYFSKFKSGIRDGLKTLFVRLSVFKDQASILREYPRRSAEFYTEKSPDGVRGWHVPGVALVGSNEPRLKLGLVHCAAPESDLLNRFTMEDAAPPISDELKEQILAVFAMTDVFAYCHEQMKKSATEAEAADAAGATGDGTQPLGEEKPDGEPKTDDEPKPDGDSASEGDDEMNEKDKAEFTALQGRVAELTKAYTQSERHKSLMVLEGEGFMFTMDAELKDSEDMNDAQFLRHLERLKRTSTLAPIGKHFNTAPITSGGSSGAKSIDPNRVKAYAAQHKVTFQQAYDALTQGV